jgi:hypothetical protein
MVLALSTRPTAAAEMKEPGAHVVFDMLDGFSLQMSNGWAAATDSAEDFAVRMRGTDHGFTDIVADEKYALDFVTEIKNAKIAKHGTMVNFDNFGAMVLSGSAQFDNRDTLFSIYLAIDKKNAKRGVVILVTSNDAGYRKYMDRTVAALRKLHSY